MLSRLVSKLRNAQLSHHSSVYFPEISFCLKVLDLLWDEGFIGGYTKLHNGFIEIILLYEEGVPLLKRLLVISRPTKRCYASCGQLSNFSLLSGSLIVSTTQGIMTSTTAIRRGLGGEILVYFE